MTDPPSRFAAFLSELRHRRVFRVAAVYACVAFIIIQIIDGAFDYLRIPEWVGTTIIVLLALGFFIAVGMAWAFDLTEEGLVRAKPKREPTAAKAPRHIVIGNKSLAVIAALAIIVAAWSWWGRPPQAGPITSIAVLPLDDLMGDPEQEYFTEGMHEALISALHHISALTVTSRTSAMRYKDADMLVTEIAEELGVDAVVEGSVLLAGDQVRISVQLIDGKTDKHLWAEMYDRDLRDILSLHSDVARAIAEGIGLALTPVDEAYLASAPQVNPEAYRLYLKGWHFHNMESEESMPKAVEYLEQAVALDPTFARAWAALGHSYHMMQWLGGWDRDYAYNRMKQALDKSLNLDPNQAQAHAYLGIYQYEYHDFDIAGAEASFRRALELDPDNVHARYEYGLFLHRTGRPDEAMSELRRAHELDPLNRLPLTGIGSIYSTIRQYDKALEYFQAALELAPGHGFARYRANNTKREILMQQGRYAEAAAEAEKWYAETADEWEKGESLLLQLRAEWALGNKEKVHAVWDSLRSSGWEQEYPFGSAQFYVIMGMKEKALDLLERAYEDTIPEVLSFLIGLVYYSDFDPLRAEPRFKALLQKIGLTEVFDQYGRRIR